MKNKNLHKIFVILGFIFINTNIFAQLNGTYTINSAFGNFSGNPLGVSGKNYSSFTNAVNALTAYGVSGHVIFEVASNTYNEQISIPNIATTSTTKTITFQSSSGNNADVILQSPTAGANYVVEFNGCSFVGFRNMTLKNNSSTITWGKVFVLNTVLNNCNGILIENNKVISKNYSSYDANNIPIFHTAANGSYDVNDLKIRDNIIENGSVSIQLIGFSSAVRENGNIIENNYLANFHEYGIYIENNDQLSISKNTIQSKGSNPGTDYGIYVKYSDNNSKIEKNKIIISGATISSFGIYLSNSNVASSNPNIISNNIIAFTSGTGDNKGIYATTIKYTQFLFNTVNIKSGSASSYCFYPYAITNSTDCKAEGNIFSNQVGGYAIKLQDPHNLASCNYNCLYSTGTNIGYFGFTDKTYAQWQALSLDLNSINILPTFVSNADLHLASEQVGLKIAPLNALVIDDIDNQVRTGNPVYVGADEFDIMSLRPHMALAFSNSVMPNEYVTVADNVAFDFTNQMSAEVWFKPYWIGNQKIMGRTNGTATAGWVMAINGGNLEVELWDGAAVKIGSFAGPIRVGNWYHLAFTWNANGNLKIYINGFEVASTPATGTNLSNIAFPLYIGIAPWDVNQFPADGEMDEVRLWNIERTPAQIFENAHKRLIGNESNLVAYYDFDQTSGNVLTNIQGTTALNGTLNANFELPLDWVTSNAMVPYIVNVSNISSDGFKLDWLPVHNATNFYYDLSVSPTFATFIQQNVSLPMGTSFNVTGLSLVEGQDYYIRMWCDVGVWTSPFTGKFQFKFMSPSGNNLNFDGVDDEIVLNGNYATITNQITVEFWEYGLNSSNTSTTICQGLDASNNRYFVAHLPWSDGNIYFDAGYDGTNDRIQKASSIDDWSGKWTHWAFTKNCTSGQMVIYRNGEIWQSGAGYTKPFAGAITKFSIGASGTGTEFFKGKIDEFRIWNVARTQAEIQADMYNLIDDSHANYTNLIEYFRFDQGFPDANNTSLSEELISYSNSCTLQTINGFQFNGSSSNWNFSGKEGTAILTTTSVSNITATTADINMQIFSVGTGTVGSSEYGAVWSSSPCPTIANSIMFTTNAFVTGDYTKSISGLLPSSTYYVRAYTNNTTGVSYGETLIFNTDAAAAENTLEFDGVNEYVSVLNSASLNFTNELTIEGWVYVNNANLNQKIVGKTDASTGGFSLGCGAFGELEFEVWDNTSANYNCFNPVFVSNKWIHVAVTWKTGGDIVLYKDGVEVKRVPASLNPIGSVANNLIFGIAAWDLTSFPFAGKLDEFRIWNVVRSPEQIRKGMCDNVTVASLGLVAYYKFNQAGGFLLNDATTNAINGNLVNMEEADWLASNSFTTWTGSNSINWADNMNWTNGVPGTSPAAENVGIRDVANVPSLFASQFISNLVLQTNSEISIDFGGMNLHCSGNVFNYGTTSNSGAVELDGTKKQFILGEFNNIIHKNPNNIELVGDVLVNNSATFNTGNFILNNYDFILNGSSTVSGANNTGYFITNGQGVLNKEIVNGSSKTFEVGTLSTYCPIYTFTNNGNTDEFSVRVYPDVTDDGTETGATLALIEDCVKLTWLVNEEVVDASSNVDMQFYWYPDQEGATFDLNNCAVGHYTGGAWVADFAGIGGSGAFNSRQINSVTNFSPFAVGDLQSPMAKSGTLCGNYTIGDGLAIDYPGGTNFDTFTDAVNALSAYGVSCAVTFTVKTGTYNEQISIPSISGTSNVNTITFQSESGFCDDAILDFSPTGSASNYVIQFNGSSFISFKNMTIRTSNITNYGRVIVFRTNINNVGYISFEGNKIIGNITSSYNLGNITIYHQAANSTYSANNIRIINNKIANGSESIYLSGFNDLFMSQNNLIQNNEITGFLSYGIDFANCDNTNIYNNFLLSRKIYSSVFGIYLNYCSNSNIIKNKIQINATSYSSGIYLSNCFGTAGTKMKVANNFISILTGSSGNKGIECHISSYIDLYHNSIFLKTGDFSSTALYCDANASNTVNIQNNLFVNRTSGLALHLTTTLNITNCNFNVCYSEGSDIFLLDATGYSNLTDWQLATSFDNNSIIQNPLFVSDFDLHLFGEQLSLKFADFISDVNSDIDENPRITSPVYAGADEFNIQNLCGNYTIDLNSPTNFPVGNNFNTFTDAVNTLISNGISCAVTFTVKDGTYPEYIYLENITGSSSVNTITFIAENPQVPVIEYDAATDWLLEIDGASHIRFYNLVFNNIAADPDNTGIVLISDFSNSCTNIIIDGNIFNETSPIDPYVYYTLDIFANNDASITNISITNNQFNNGSSALSVGVNNNGDKLKNIKINNNSFSDYLYRGLSVEYCDSIEIIGNTFIGRGTNSEEYGIDFSNSNGPAYIISNNISCTASDYTDAVRISGVGSALNPIYFMNNMVYAQNDNTASDYAGGVTIEIGSEYIYVINNTVVVENSDWTYAFYMEPISNLVFLNNIAVNNSDGYTIYLDDYGSGEVSAWNNNIINITGSGFLETSFDTYANLVDWNLASGYDGNSFEEIPPFISSNDLHINTTILTNVESNGTAISLLNDIDGDIRFGEVGYAGTGSAKDIGADEGEFIAIATPTAPITLTLISGFGQVAMQWDQNNDPDFDHYNIYVSLNSDLSAPVYTTTISPNTTLSYLVVDLQSNIDYYFGVSVVNTSSIESAILIKNIKPLNSVIAGFGNCLDFDGVDDEMFVANSASLNFGTGSFTIECWIKLDDFNQTAVIYEKAENSGNFTQVALWVNGPNPDNADPGKRIHFTLYGIAGITERKAYTDRDIIDGNWHHIAAVADPSKDLLKIYVDGIDENITFVKIGAWPNISNIVDVRIMYDNTLPVIYQHSKGFIDELRIWNFPRTKKEIIKDMYSTINAGFPGLVTYYRFDENNYDNVWDFASGANHGKLLNNPTWKYPGAPIRVVTKKDYTKSGNLKGEDINGSSGVTYSVSTAPAGSINITDNQSGAAEYIRNFYGYDSFEFNVSSNDDSENMNYHIQILPFISEKGRIDDFTNLIGWIADTIRVYGDIYIGNDTIVYINEDTYVEFYNDFKIDVKGGIIASGALGDSIEFNAKNPVIGWKGIDYYYTNNSNDTSYFVNCIFENVKETGGSGYGVFKVDNYSKLIIGRSVFRFNTADHGAAVSLFANSNIKLIENEFYNNSSNIGGAIYIDNSSPLLMYNHIFNNIAFQDGGAIYYTGNSANPEIITNAIYFNDSQYGGAINANWNSDGKIKNNIFVKNNALFGGAIYSSNSDVEIVNNTFFGNDVTNNGGAISFNYNCNSTIKNNIFWNNTINSSVSNQIHIALASYLDPNFEFNDIQDGLAGFSGAGAGGDYTGTYSISNIEAIPNFTNTGTDDYTLLSNSPCIDKGDPGTDINGYSIDLAGNPRINFCYIDLGCYEAQNLTFAGYNNVWLGCVDDNWHEPDNWSNLTVPIASDVVLIPGNTPFQPFIQFSDAECKSIDLNTTNGAKITIANGLEIIVGP